MSEPRVAIAYDCLFPVNAGGGERVYRRLAELFVDRGSAVTYLTRDQWSAAEPPMADFEIAPVWHGEIYDQRGIRTKSSALGFASGLFRHFLRHRASYDLVIVSALPVLNVFAVRFALLGAGVKLATDWLEVWSWRKWRTYSGPVTGTVAFVLQWLGLRVGQLQTADSAFTAQRVRRYRRKAEPIVLGLVDLVGDEVNASTQRSGEPHLLFVGRHIADKRLDALPAALAMARRRHPTLTAVIVGEGPETGVVRERVDDLGLSSAVRFTGRVDDHELARLFAGATMLVNPSEREGFGLVVAEAAAHATPSVVVAGEDNAAAELITDGVNGFVAASAEPEVLGAAIARVIDAGEPLRATTLRWFRRQRETHGLAASVEDLVARYLLR